MDWDDMHALPLALVLSFVVGIDHDAAFQDLPLTQILVSEHTQYASADSSDTRTALPVISCTSGMVAVQRPNLDVVCLLPDTAQKLERRGWTILHDPVPDHIYDAQDATVDKEPDDAMTALRLAHIVADGKVTLENVEHKIPQEGNVHMPVTREYAESTLLPRLAAAIDGDKIILPPHDPTPDKCNRPGAEMVFIESEGCEISTNWYYYLHYSTENGNVLSAARMYAHDGTEIIPKIRIMVYERFWYDELEEFVVSFMENAGFDIVGEPDMVDPNTISVTAPALEWLSFDNIDFVQPPWVQTTFTGWYNNPPKYDLGHTIIKKIAKEYTPKYVELYDKNKCPVFRKLLTNDFISACHWAISDGTYDHYYQCPISPDDYRDPELYARYTIGDILVYSVKIGYCYKDETLQRPLDYSKTHVRLLLIEGSKGEIVWPANADYIMVEDWIDRIDIPESAKVRNDTSGGNER